MSEPTPLPNNNLSFLGVCLTVLGLFLILFAIAFSASPFEDVRVIAEKGHLDSTPDNATRFGYFVVFDEDRDMCVVKQRVWNGVMVGDRFLWICDGVGLPPGPQPTRLR